MTTIREMLSHNNELREAAKLQWKDYEEGKTAKEPSVKLSSFDLVERLLLNGMGDYTSKGICTVKETLMSTDTARLIPKVIEGQLRESEQEELIASRFFKTIQLSEGNSAVYVVPVVSELTASEVAEGGRYPETSLDMNTLESTNMEIRVKKVGLRVSMTEEAITDGTWQIFNMNLSKAGRAMGRYKEMLCYNTFQDHGHIVFDNAVNLPEAHTSGRNAQGEYNDTLSTEDFIDLVLAMMSNGHNCTDIIVHPLCWTIWAKNAVLGNGLTYGAMGGFAMHPWGQTQHTPGFAGLAAEQGPQKYILSPDQVQGRLPLPMVVNFSNQVPFNKKTKRFDMFAIDRNECGIILEREALTTENWTDVERDIRLIKCKARYGVGILDHGRGVAIARNLAVQPTWPVPPAVTVVTQNKD